MNNKYVVEFIKAIVIVSIAIVVIQIGSNQISKMKSITCTNIERNTLDKKLQDEYFDDNTYYTLACDNKEGFIYIDDDADINPDGIYTHGENFSTKPPKSETNFEQVKSNQLNGS